MKNKKFEIVLELEGKDYESVLLKFYKTYPDLKDKFKALIEVKHDNDINKIMEQKLMLETLVSMFNRSTKEFCDVSLETTDIIKLDDVHDIKSIVSRVRNRLVLRKK